MKKIIIPLKIKRLLLITAVVIAGIAIWLIFFHKPTPVTVKTANTFIIYQSKQLDTALQKGDYETANADCIAIGANTTVASGLDNAISSYQGCIQRLPANKVDWSTYIALAQLAKKKGDNQLELNSLKQAQARIKATNADVSADTNTYIQSRIKQLGG